MSVEINIFGVQKKKKKMDQEQSHAGQQTKLEPTKKFPHEQ